LLLINLLIFLELISELLKNRIPGSYLIIWGGV